MIISRWQMNKPILVCLGLFVSQSAHSSGLYFYEIATEDTALAGRARRHARRMLLPL